MKMDDQTCHNAEPNSTPGQVVRKVEGLHRWVFFCPGCRCGHLFQVAPATPAWEWNGDVVRPTVSPSILVRSVDAAGNPTSCHSFVRDGQIQFLGDCSHALAGKTVPLEPF